MQKHGCTGYQKLRKSAKVVISGSLPKSARQLSPSSDLEYPLGVGYEVISSALVLKAFNQGDLYSTTQCSDRRPSIFQGYGGIMARIMFSFNYQHFHGQVALLFFSLILVSAASIRDNGKLVTLGDSNYYAGGPSVSRVVSVGLNSSRSNADIIPITVIRTNETVLTGDIIRDVISDYSASDDVFQPGFLNSES